MSDLHPLADDRLTITLPDIVTTSVPKIKFPSWFLYPEEQNIFIDRLQTMLFNEKNLRTLNITEAYIKIPFNQLWPTDTASTPSYYHRKYEELIESIRLKGGLKTIRINPELAHLLTDLGLQDGVVTVFSSLGKDVDDSSALRLNLNPDFLKLIKSLMQSRSKNEIVYMSESEFSRYNKYPNAMRMAKLIAEYQMTGNYMIKSYEEVLDFFGYPKTKKFGEFSRTILQKTIQRHLEGTRFEFKFEIFERKSNGVSKIKFRFKSNADLVKEKESEMATYPFERYLREYRYNDQPLPIRYSVHMSGDIKSLGNDEIKNRLKQGALFEPYINHILNTTIKRLSNATPNNEKHNVAAYIKTLITHQYEVDSFVKIYSMDHEIKLIEMVGLSELERGKQINSKKPTIKTPKEHDKITKTITECYKKVFGTKDDHLLSILLEGDIKESCERIRIASESELRLTIRDLILRNWLEKRTIFIDTDLKEIGLTGPQLIKAKKHKEFLFELMNVQVKYGDLCKIDSITQKVLTDMING